MTDAARKPRTIRFSDAEWAEVEAAATRNERYTTEWARRTLLAAARGAVVSVPSRASRMPPEPPRREVATRFKGGT